MNLQMPLMKKTPQLKHLKWTQENDIFIVFKIVSMQRLNNVEVGHNEEIMTRDPFSHKYILTHTQRI